MSPVRRGRDSGLFRTLRARLRDERRPCWLCGQAIDYGLPAGDPSAFTADHIVPLSLDPDRAELYSNLAAAHWACNRDRAAKKPVSALGQGAVVRQW